MELAGVHQIAIRATDIDASIAFYRDTLGLRLIARFDPPGIAFFDAGGTRLMLARDAPQSQFYLSVKDGPLALARDMLIAAGIKLESEIVRVHRDEAGQFGSAGMEEWMVFLRDPDGNLLGLVERR